MAIEGYLFNEILKTDTFSEWADKCNIAIRALSDTNFATLENVVDIPSAQSITGTKTFLNVIFNATTTANGPITTQGNNTFNMRNNIINVQPFTSFNIIGSQGAIFKCTDTCPDGPRLRPSSYDTLSFSHSDVTLSAKFYIHDDHKLILGGTNPILGVADYNWVLPTSAPTANAVLTWNHAGGDILVWENLSNFISSIASDVGSTLASSNFILPIELIPVGTVIKADTNVLTSWNMESGEYVPDEKYVGWLPLTGQALSYDEATDDIEYRDLIRLLTGTSGATGSVTLADYRDNSSPPGIEIGIDPDIIDVVYLIKYKKDSTTVFQIAKNTPGIILKDTAGTSQQSLDIKGGSIGLDINTTDFTFIGNTLTLSNTSSDVVNNTIVKRNNFGRFKAADPIEDPDVATKGYVDTAISNSIRTDGTVFALSQPQSDGTASGGPFIIDKNYKVRLSAGFDYFSIGAFSPITDQDAKFKNIVSPRSGAWNGSFSYRNASIFGIDEHDVLYTRSGRFLHPTRSHANYPGVSYATKMQIRLGSAYGSDFASLAPGFLPSLDSWPAPYVKCENIIFGQTRSYGAAIKTLDGWGNTIDNTTGDLTAHFDNGVATTRGYYLIGNIPTYATGSGTSFTSYSAPTVFGPNGAGRVLWDVFGNRDRVNGTAPTQDSFHFYKPNHENYDSAYPWYIKKIFISSNIETVDGTNNVTTYAIIGKPTNEYENQLWVVGSGSLYEYGNNLISDNYDFQPINSPTSSGSFPTNSIVLEPGTTAVYKKADGTPHGLDSYMTVNIASSSTPYYIVTGDANNANQDTHFRITTSGSYARSLYVNGGVGGAVELTANQRNGKWFIYPVLKGVLDLSISKSNDSLLNTCMALVIDSNIESLDDANALDGIPIINHNIESLDFYAWGNNKTYISQYLQTSSGVFTNVSYFASYTGSETNSTVLRRPFKIPGRWKNDITNLENLTFKVDIEGITFIHINDKLYTLSHTSNRFETLDIFSDYSVEKVFTLLTSSTITNVYTIHCFYVVSKNNKNYLFADFVTGNNRVNDPTILPFPEDPINIVGIQDEESYIYSDSSAARNSLSVTALCKDYEEQVEGRFYKMGNTFVGNMDTRYMDTRLNSSSSRFFLHPHFTDANHFIL